MAHPAVKAAVAVSSPVDLASCALLLDENPRNKFYLKRFLDTLKAKTLAKGRRFPELRDRLCGRDGVNAVRTIREFDNRITAPVHGFANAEDYWAKASALPHLAQIQIPSLLLSAKDDPLLGADSFPEDIARRSPSFHLEAPSHGGHVGFLDFQAGLQPWSERRVRMFLDNLGL
jgi:predicted alpha/beta-fold hydrolase